MLIKGKWVGNYCGMVGYFDRRSVQSALRRPEIRTFTWKIAFCIACMRMTSRAGACLTTKKMGKLFNTVTFDEGEFSVYFIDI